MTSKKPDQANLSTLHRVFIVLAVLMLSFVMWASHQATQGNKNVFVELAGNIPYGDKVGHFVLFGILTTVAIGATRFAGFKLLGCKFYRATVAVGAFAFVDEALQYFSANRTLDIHDFAVGLLAIGSAQLLCLNLERWYVVR